MEEVIATHDLSRVFGRRPVVHRVTLSVPEGSVFALIGPNGAGKTTMIKTLVNILEPSSGEATVMGTPSTKLGPAQFQKIGYVSESQELPEWMTVTELLAYCKPTYPSWDDAFCKFLLRQLDLEPEQKIKHLSRGMKAKAALLSSLAYRPRLLILDEPFGGLDALVREEFIRGILELTGQDRWTVLMASHEIDELERLAEWIGILNKGRLELCESVASLQARFRQIELRVGDEGSWPSAWPVSWLLAEKSAQRLQFVETQYEPHKSEQFIRQLFPTLQQVLATPMSLKSIFVALARAYRLSHEGGL
jgi:ABC-2 type transport system ATP-binding protein